MLLVVAWHARLERSGLATMKLGDGECADPRPRSFETDVLGGPKRMLTIG